MPAPTTSTAAPHPDLWVSVDGAPLRRLATHAPSLVGRGPACSLPVSGTTVSAHHLDVRPSAWGWVVTDLGTTHGTWVHGARLDRPTRVDRPLRVVLGHPDGGSTVLDLVPTPAAGPGAGGARGGRPGSLLRAVAVLVVLAAVFTAVGAIADQLGALRGGGAAMGQPGGSSAGGLDALPTTVPTVEGASGPSLGGLYRGDGRGEGIEALLTASVEDVHRYWEQVFADAGLAPPSVRYQWPSPGQSIEIPCTDRDDPDAEIHSDEDTASYCRTDDSITIATTAAQYLWEGRYVAHDDDVSDLPAGDGAVAFVVAHEYAHNIQAELGVGSGRGGDRPRPTIALELHADCLAGVWAHSALRSGVIDESHLDEAAGAVARAGDYEVDAPNHHGTPAQRIEAFELGASQGAPAVCTPLLDTPRAR